MSLANVDFNFYVFSHILLAKKILLNLTDVESY